MTRGALVIVATKGGLSTTSQVMVDKIVSVPRGAIVREVGRCDPNGIAAMDDARRLWLGL